MGVIFRPVRAGAFAVMGLAIAALTGALASAGPATAAPAVGQGVVALTDSVTPTTDTIIGGYTDPKMQIEVAVAPRDPAGLNAELAALYDKNSSSYHHWLTNGQFDARFAPTASTQASVASFLARSGLTVTPSSSPFLVRASGSSARVSAAFHTTMSTFKDPRGVTYFSNSTPVYLPGTVAGNALGVIGLSNTVRDTPGAYRIDNVIHPAGKSSGATNCETSYPTRQQLFTMFVGGVMSPAGYGGGPGCSGLTPPQTNSIYDAPDVGPRGRGAGVNLAVFELSAYQHSDIDTWAQHFYGPGYTPPLVDINVDGGPLHPVCPTEDTCPPQNNYYSGDVEVAADIEQQLSISPDAQHILVYNAPNDSTGQTVLDEYTAIANADAANVVSSSWGVCENDLTPAYAQAENVIFEQMAAQGQSMFGAAGDTGAFDCIRSDTTTIVNVDDPSSQPWVTSVGGTSLETDNPGTNPHPSYPDGVETVWNVGDLCSDSPTSPALDNETGFYWCSATGAGGGGSSQYWAGRSTRTARESPTPTPPTATALPSARWPRWAHRAAKLPTSLPTPTSSRLMPSTAQATRTLPTACARPSVISKPYPAGSGSAAPACPRRCGRGSSPIATASRAAGAATSTRCCTRCTTSPRRSISTTSLESDRPPATTACSQRHLGMTSQPELARLRWRR